MPQRISELIERIDRMSLRERALIFLAVLFVFGSAWQAFLMTSLERREKQVVSELEAVGERIKSLQQSEEQTGNGLASQPVRELQERPPTN